MRKLVNVIAVLFLMVAMTGEISAKAPNISSKEREKIEKECQKEAKKIAKNIKKAGWTIEETGLPETIIANYLEKQRIDGLETLVGTAEQSASRSKARSYIKTKTANEYAQEQSGVFKGKLDGMDKSSEEDAEEKFIKQWEGRYAMEVAGLIKIGYTQYRKNDNGTVDMEIHFLVDPESAHAAKLAAAKYAIEEQKLDQEWANNISEALKDIEP
jgi:hypothetical protein